MHSIGTKRARGLAALATMGLVMAAPVLTAGSAQAKEGRVVERGNCSQASTWKLKAQPDNGRLEIDFDVDSNVVGQVWQVTVTANGTTVFSGPATTVAPSGSFDVGAVADDQPGTDSIQATAIRDDGSETCWGGLNYNN